MNKFLIHTFYAILFLLTSYVQAAVDTRLHERLGSHLTQTGVRFTVFAPEAKSVFVCIEKDIKKAMHRLEDGLWQVDVKGAKAGQCYTYCITSVSGKKCYKLDPFAHKVLPKKAGKGYLSVIQQTNRYKWTDAKWLESRKKFSDKDEPVSIYEVHLNSWKKGTSFKKLAESLGPYCKENGYTHVELFGLLASSGKYSWGYRPLAYFAPSYEIAGFFEEFVDRMHQMGVGVILDWIPGHFSTNPDGLSSFDGSALYEHSDKRKAWGALLFDYSKEHTQNFLLSSAHFWLSHMHVDGIRVDSLDAILRNATDPMDVSRCMKQINSFIRERFPGVLRIAESWKTAGVTDENGFDFDLKWSSASNNILKFLSLDYGARRGLNAKKKPQFKVITDALFPKKNERLLWHTDHDKSRIETGSLYSQMPGTHFEKCANIRLLISYFMSLVGKKMVFMGDELAQKTDWDTLLQNKRALSSVQWELQRDFHHAGVQQMVQRLNGLYRTQTGLYKENEIKHYHTDMNNQVICFRRENLLFVCNFNHSSFDRYTIAISSSARYMRELFTSDESCFGGLGKTNPKVTFDRVHNKKECSFTIQLPPLSVLIFEMVY